MMCSRSLSAWAVGAFLALALAGCTVGPDYRSPVIDVPTEFGTDTDTAVDLAASDNASPSQQRTWWEEFGDPVLVQLINESLVGNHTIEIARARLLEARAIQSARAGRLLPAVGSSAQAGKSRASANGPGPLGSLAEAGLASLENEVYSVGFEAGWELDLFGGLRRGREASTARLMASQEALRGTLLAVAAAVADTYTVYRGAELRLEIAERNLAIQDDTLAIISAKVDSGLLAEIDLERTRTQRSTLSAALAPLRSERAAALHRLAVLLGRTPAAMATWLESRSGAAATVPVPPTAVASGLPADLLLRRPDLRAAERLLHASTADLGAAIADKFPKVSIGGSFGLESARLSDLLESAARTWTFGPSLTLPVFQGGRLEAQVAAARARLQMAEADWQRSVLAALAEVETGLVAHEQALVGQTALAEAAETSRRTSELAGVLYELGLRDHLVLLDAQRSQTAIEDALALARINVARSAIGLFRALGGGWQPLEETLGPVDESARQPSQESALAESPSSESSASSNLR